VDGEATLASVRPARYGKTLISGSDADCGLRFWKQWKRGRKRFAELRQRGIGRNLAAQTAGSPHGPWRIANSPALAIALPKAYFDSLGIPRLADLR